MEIDVREWMIIIGVLLILAVLLDGYRRMRRDPSRVKMALAKVPEADDLEDEEPNPREFPNGGARVIPRDESAESAAEPPLLTEQHTGFEPGGGFSAGDAPVDDKPAQHSATGTDSASVSPDREQQGGVGQEVVMLHVTARDEAGFSGEDILHILLACDLRFGEMNFFHRHEEAAGRGAIQFSVANMLQPGVFDIDAMAEFSTQGLIFFLTLPGPRDMMQAFELLVETAECVAKNLDGDLLDETRSVVTRQTLEHIRQRIRDLERRLLTQNNR